MTWRERMVCQILLLIARMINTDEDPSIAKELRNLATQISLYGSKADNE